MDFKVAMTIDPPGTVDYTKTLNQMEIEFIRNNCETDQEIVEISHNADFIITIARQKPIPKRVIEQLKKCKFIQTIGIGYDGIDVEAATKHAICVINNPDYCVEEVSDHAMALILACSRRIAQLDHTIKSITVGAEPENLEAIHKLWAGMSSLREKTLGLIGLGRIARLMVSKAKGFGMRLLTYDPFVSQSLVKELGVEKVDLIPLLKESDFVSIHVPLTPETKHLINLERLKKMKPSSYLINTARGPIVDEASLYTALTEGYIAGAGLDVTDPDPPSPTSPLLNLGNVILTTHSGHASPTAWARLWHNPLEEIARVVQREWPRGLINSEVKEGFVQKWGHMK